MLFTEAFAECAAVVEGIVPHEHTIRTVAAGGDVAAATRQAQRAQCDKLLAWLPREISNTIQHELLGESRTAPQVAGKGGRLPARHAAPPSRTTYASPGKPMTALTLLAVLLRPLLERSACHDGPVAPPDPVEDARRRVEEACALLLRHCAPLTHGRARECRSDGGCAVQTGLSTLALLRVEAASRRFSEYFLHVFLAWLHRQGPSAAKVAPRAAPSKAALPFDKSDRVGRLADPLCSFYGALAQHPMEHFVDSLRSAAQAICAAHGAHAAALGSDVSVTQKQRGPTAHQLPTRSSSAKMRRAVASSACIQTRRRRLETATSSSSSSDDDSTSTASSPASSHSRSPVASRTRAGDLTGEQGKRRTRPGPAACGAHGDEDDDDVPLAEIALRR